MLPSWIRSRNCRPRFVYFLAIDTTRRRLASTSSALARSALRSPSCDRARVSRSTVSDRPASSSTSLIFALAVGHHLGQLFQLLGPDAELLLHRPLAGRPTRGSRAESCGTRAGSCPSAIRSRPTSRLAASIRVTYDLSRATMRSICFLLSRSSCSASNISFLRFGKLVLGPLARGLRGAAGGDLLLDLLRLLVQAADLVDDLAHPLDVPLLVELGVFLVGVLDDVFDPDLELAQLVARDRGSPRIATAQLSTTCSTRRSPSSMRLAISTSPSRVSSETEPILRRYMRTGSLVLE